jgi:hypothetical protein
MRRILSLFLIITAQFILSAETRAQTSTPSCPSVRIEFKADLPPGMVGFSNLFCPGGSGTFTATVSGVGPDEALTFNWVVSHATILSGQGTSTIKVLTEEIPDEEVIAEVEVGGLHVRNPECGRHASKTVGTALCCLPPCPTLSIICPTDIPLPGASVNFAANISGNDPNRKLKYKWQVSAGKIIDGQGTPVISVDTSGTEGQTITATVEVDGLPPECERTDSCSFILESNAPPGSDKRGP